MEDLTEIELDQKIGEEVRQMVESVTPPPLEESWTRFEAKLEAHRSRQRDLRSSKPLRLPLPRAAIAAGAVVLLAGLLACAFPVRARAIGERVVERVTTLLNGTQVNVRTGYAQHEPGERQPAAPDEGFRETGVGPEMTVSLDEARARCPFSIPVPDYLPSGFRIGQVRLQELNRSLVQVTIDFTGPGARCFSIVCLNSPDQYGQGFGYDRDDTAVEDFRANGTEGKLAVFKNDTIRAMWISQGVVYTLEGDISREEALKTIASMQ